MKSRTFLNKADGTRIEAAKSHAKELEGVITPSSDATLQDFVVDFPDGSTARVAHYEKKAYVTAYDEHGALVQVLRLFSDAQGTLVEALWPVPGSFIEYCSQGGGAVHKLSRAEFGKRFQAAEFGNYALGSVTADWLPEDFTVPAYFNDRRWNGWVMPYFTYNSAMKLVPHMPGLRYDPKNDEFVMEQEDGEEASVERFTFEFLYVAKESVKVYAIGAGSWCWEQTR